VSLDIIKSIKQSEAEAEQIKGSLLKKPGKFSQRPQPSLTSFLNKLRKMRKKKQKRLFRKLKRRQMPKLKICRRNFFRMRLNKTKRQEEAGQGRGDNHRKDSEPQWQ